LNSHERSSAQPLLALTVAAVFIALTGNGCSALQNLLGEASPSLQVQTLEIESLHWQEIKMKAYIDVENPLPLSFSTKAISYSINLDDVPAISANSQLTSEIDAATTSRIAVPIRLNVDSLARVIGELKDKTATDLTLDISVLLAVPVAGKTEFSDQFERRIPIPKMPAIALHNLRLESMGFGTADLLLQLAIDNPNSFGVKIDRLDFKLSLAGAKWLESNAGKAIAINAAADQMVDIPFTLRFGAVGSALYNNLLRGKNLTYELGGSFSLSAAPLPLAIDDIRFSHKGKVNMGQDK
jgi:LEA14-like dessication related protein